MSGSEDLASAVGALKGLSQRLEKDLDIGRQRMHELANAISRLDARLETLVEAAVPQRERMIRKLDEIEGAVAPLKGIAEKVNNHSDKIAEHEAFKNKALGMVTIIGASAGSMAYGAISLGKYLAGIKQ